MSAARRLVSLLWLVPVLVALALAAPPRASAEDVTEYDQFIRRAIGEVEQGNWDEARALFRRAHELNPNARTWRGLGISAFETRQYVEAIAELEAALADPRKALTPEQRDEAKSLLARARDFISVLRVQVSPPGAEVLVDGARAELHDGTLFLDPGPHTVVARAPGFEERETTLRANAGEQQELAIELRVSARDIEQDDTASPHAVRVPERRKKRYIATWVLAGTAVAAGGAGLGLGLMTAGKHDDFEACQRTMPGSCRSLSDDGKQLQLLTNITLGVSGAAAIGSLVAFFVERRGGRADTARVALVPGVRGLGLRGAF